MVNVDTVYQTVQALANKEQRGYLTPQEFNLLANQVQEDIFEQYFYDLNALRGQRPQEHEIGDSVTYIMDKINGVDNVTYSLGNVANNGTQLPGGRIGKLFLNQGGARRELKVANPDAIQDLLSSKWHQEGFTDAVYFDDGFRAIQVWDGNGQITAGITCERFNGRPSLVNWGYIVVNEKPMYNPGSSNHFDLHWSEQADIVVKVLKLAGVSIEDPQLYQAAAAEEQQNIQQENK